MSLIPMDAGQKAILPDGVQVDHISENTLNHGNRIRGISDPTTYPIIAGDIGENNTATGGSVSLTSGASLYTNILTIPIPSAGVWRVELALDVYNNASGTTWTSGYNIIASISNSSTTHDASGNLLATRSITPASNTAYVRVFSGNCVRLITTTSSANYYSVLTGAVFTGSAPSAQATYLLTRIA